MQCETVTMSESLVWQVCSTIYEMLVYVSRYKMQTMEGNARVCRYGECTSKFWDIVLILYQPQGRARRDAALRAMQGWHSQKIIENEDEAVHIPKVILRVDILF